MKKRKRHAATRADGKKRRRDVEIPRACDHTLGEERKKRGKI